MNFNETRIEALASLVAIALPGVIAAWAYIRKRAEVKKTVVNANSQVMRTALENGTVYNNVVNNRR